MVALSFSDSNFLLWGIGGLPNKLEYVQCKKLSFTLLHDPLLAKFRTDDRQERKEKFQGDIEKKNLTMWYNGFSGNKINIGKIRAEKRIRSD